MNIVRGMRVSVPFGPRSAEGYVLGLSDTAQLDESRIKAIRQPLEDYPALLPPLIDLAQEIARDTHCPLAEALRLMLPAQMRGGRVKIKTETAARLLIAGDDLQAALTGCKNARKRRLLLEMLSDGQPHAVAELRQLVKDARTGLNDLCQRGYAELIEHEILRSPYPDTLTPTPDPALTDEQQEALSELLPAVERALGILKERSPLPLAWEEGVPMLLATQCGGDVRKAINACELLYEAAETKDGELLLTSEDALQVAQRSAMRYDKGGDAMYDMASALMKSLRGSDPDAALHYLARFLEAGDLVTPCRRLLCSASEDIGMAYPQAVAIVKACVDTAMQLGLPEAQLPLAQAAILLATAPKSNSVVEGINAAWADVRRGRTGDIPRELQNVHADSTGLEREQGYKYPHEFPNHWVKQQYLPDPIKNAVYYRYGDNKVEQAAAKYWEAIKNVDGH